MPLSTEEEQLVKILGEIGPVIAIGRPGEELPHLGAARFYISHDLWQNEVSRLMSNARLVVLRAGDTEGLWWEVERTTQLVRPERIVFLLPINQQEYNKFRAKAHSYLPCRLPDLSLSRTKPSGTIGAILYFNPDWTPCLANLARLLGVSISFRWPLAPLYKWTLRPVFEQLQLPWNPPKRNWGLVLFIALFPIIFSSCLVGPILWFTEKPGSIQAMLDRASERLTAEPQFLALVAGLSEHEQHALGTDLVRRGLARLDDGSLVARALLLRTMIEKANVSSCAALSRGTISEAQLFGVLEQLQQSDMEKWVGLVTDAALAELKNSASPLISEPQVQEAYTNLLARLRVEDAERMNSVFTSAGQVPDEEQCWAERTFLRALTNLSEPYRSILARATIKRNSL